jgi:exodeoxyribonuclease VII large subunit
MSISPVGEGSIKKAAQLLQAKLEKEGLFDTARKRPLPALPQKVGLITAASSAAYADFVKILDERWGGVEVHLADVYVQGQQAPGQIITAIDYFSEMPAPPDVLVITRGGGSAEDLAAFSDERVVRAVAASRIPTLVAVGHEIDVSLAELAADLRASTPSNAVQLLVPDKTRILSELKNLRAGLKKMTLDDVGQRQKELAESRKYLTSQVFLHLTNAQNQLKSTRKLVSVFDPLAALARGYAIVSQGSKHISSVKGLKAGDKLRVRLADGTISTEVVSGK